MSIDAGDARPGAHDHNPWGNTDRGILTPGTTEERLLSSRPSRRVRQPIEDQPLRPVGRRGVGKTTPSISSFTIASRPVMIQNDSLSPFDADPLYQTPIGRTATACSSVLREQDFGRIEADHPHFILIDDVHQIEHPNKPTIDGWGVPVAELLKDVPGRHVVVTASAGIQVERELESVAIPAEDYDIQPILPRKFRTTSSRCIQILRKKRTG